MSVVMATSILFEETYKITKIHDRTESSQCHVFTFSVNY